MSVTENVEELAPRRKRSDGEVLAGELTIENSSPTVVPPASETVELKSDSGAQALQVSNKRLGEALSRITDAALVELRSLQGDIAELIGAIEKSHEARIEANGEHAALSVDAIAVKVIVSEQVATIRKRFQRYLETT